MGQIKATIKKTNKSPKEKAIFSKTVPHEKEVHANTDRSISGNYEQMIAEAAYFLAEKRSFNEGDPVQDWLDAEQQISQLLKSH